MTMPGRRDEPSYWEKRLSSEGLGSLDFDEDDTTISVPPRCLIIGINVGSSDWKETYFEQTSGASLRILVEMSTPPRILFKLAGTVTDYDRPKLVQDGNSWTKWSFFMSSKQQTLTPLSPTLPKISGRGSGSCPYSVTLSKAVDRRWAVSPSQR